jgi:hypothetical protein
MKNKITNDESICSISLGILIALFHVITPELRAVTFNLDNINKIFSINFYHDGEASEKNIDLWQCASTEASCRLSPDFHSEEKIIRIDYPKKIPDDEILIYYRKEPKILANIKKTEELIKCDYSEKEFFSAKIRCLMQKAILGNITSNIRQINIEWRENHIYLLFYYHGEIFSLDKENMYQIASKLFSYLPNFYIFLRYFTINEPILLPVHKEFIYARYEKDYGQEALFKPLH